MAGLALPRLHLATPRAESPSRFLIPTGPAVTLHQSIATFDSPGKSRSVNPTGLSHLLLPATLYITFGTGSYWCRPELVCQVEYGGFTEDGKLVYPVFKALREDKSPQECMIADALGWPNLLADFA